MRIGVNALYMIPGGVGGTEIYLRCLLEELAAIDDVNEYLIFTNQETGTDLAPEHPRFQHLPQPVRAVNRPARILWEQTRLPFAVRSQRIDVLFNPGFTAPAFCSCPMVTVFHDVQHKRHPEYFRWFDLPFWEMFLFVAAHRSKIVLADSEVTRRDLLRYYKLPADNVRAVPLGVDKRFFDIGRQRREDRIEPYLLAVSTLHPHKNFECLIRVFAEFRRKRPEFRLIIAGMRGFQSQAVEQLITQLGLRDSVRLTGWIPREELYDLFLHAYGFVYPTTFEGFGLPVVEALAAAVPTACSTIEPVKSNAADAAVLFDPEDPNGILDAIVRLTSDPELRAKLAKAGPRRAADFSWMRTAEATLQALRDAVG